MSVPYVLLDYIDAYILLMVDKMRFTASMEIDLKQ